MKKVLLFLVFVGFLVGLYFYLKTPDSNPLYLSPGQQISPTPAEKASNQQIIATINAINARNAKLRNFICDNVDIKYNQKIRVHITGTIAMEKEKKFRMKVRSIAGQELDLGSNDTHFWFWSKRMNPPVLHYAKHEDLGKSMLKTPLNPGWMMGSLNLGTIDTTGAEVFRYGQHYGVLAPKTAANGENVTVFTLIDPQKQAVIGHYLYGANGKLQASSEVKSHQNINGFIVPKEMFIIWYSEGVSLEWTLNNPRINTTINPSNWIMPTMRGAIDMGQTGMITPRKRR
jgi:hypothetical protein